jgi:hypothetical protein
MGKGEFKRSRLIQRVKVAPWRNYHLSALVKMQDCTNQDIRIMGLGKFPLNWTPLPIEKTMAWTRLDVTFNSLDNEEVGLYLGSWAGREGSMWWDDVRLEPAGFINIIRRDSLPLTIIGEDGTAYVEGEDFDRVVDLGLKAIVSAWHQPPAVTIPAGSRLKEGQRVRASFHHAATNLTTNNSPICMSEPKTYDEIRISVRFLAEHLHPDAYFFAHDEIRQCGWDDTCAKRGLTCGQILADNIARCVAIVEEVDPGKPMVVWSDLFDPFHNAKKSEGDAPYRMFLCKGEAPWWESWKGMPKRLGVVNWNNGNVDSARFFAGEAHPQILSHVDPAKLKAWLEATADQPGIVGAMYTTWTDDWKPLEAYAEAFRQGWKTRK